MPRSPFDFNRRVKVAKMYLKDGAYLTCADRLEALAKDIQAGVAEGGDAGLQVDDRLTLPQGCYSLQGNE